jgi:thiamine biosynthesis lipoprotein
MEIKCKKVLGKIIVCCLLPMLSLAQLKRYQLTQPKMGSPFTITLYHHDSLDALNKMQQAFRLVDTMNAMFSDYDSLALAYKMSDAKANEWITVPEEMMRVLLMSKKAHQVSEGKFDVTMGALSRLWRKQRKLEQFPSAEAVKAVLTHTGWDKVELDGANLHIRKKDGALLFDFGGIAKGYAAQRVVDFLAASGIPSSLVDAGGDIACGVAPPEKAGWSIAVNLPQQEEKTWPGRLYLQHKSVATSGDMYQVMEHDGKFYSHIIDPSTGYGGVNRRNVTVIASEGATADWLATAFSLLPMKRVRRLAKKMKADFLIAEMENEKPITYRSRHFPRLQ